MQRRLSPRGAVFTNQFPPSGHLISLLVNPHDADSKAISCCLSLACSFHDDVGSIIFKQPAGPELRRRTHDVAVATGSDEDLRPASRSTNICFYLTSFSLFCLLWPLVSAGLSPDRSDKSTGQKEMSQQWNLPFFPQLKS